MEPFLALLFHFSENEAQICNAFVLLLWSGAEMWTLKNTVAKIEDLWGPSRTSDGTITFQTKKCVYTQTSTRNFSPNSYLPHAVIRTSSKSRTTSSYQGLARVWQASFHWLDVIKQHPMMLGVILTAVERLTQDWSVRNELCQFYARWLLWDL